MSFWLHQNAVTRFVHSVQPLYCYAIACLLALMLAGAGGFWFIRPLMLQAGAVSKQYQKLADQASAFEKVLEQVPLLRARNKDLVKERSQYAAEIAVLQDTVNDLLLMMRRQKVSCRGIARLSTIEKTFHDTHLMSLRAKGTFNVLVELLHILEKPEYPITLRAVRLVQEKGQLLTLDAIIHVISVKDE